jgi:HEAT repeat protein
MDDSKRYAAVQQERIKLVYSLIRAGGLAVPDLVAALNDESWPSRSYAAYALGVIGDDHAVEPLRRIMNSRAPATSPSDEFRDKSGFNDANTDLRQECAIALARMCQPDGLVHAMRSGTHLYSSGGIILQLPLSFLPSGTLEYPSEVEPLLAAISGPGDVEPLIACLDDRSEIVRKRAAALLGKIRDRRAVDPLIKSLGDKEENVAITAAIALGRIGDPRAVDALVATAIRTSSASGAAAEALAAIGDANAVPRLADVEKNEYWTARVEAIRTIDKLGGPDANSSLEAILAAEIKRGVELQVFVAAAGALARRGDSSALSLLRKQADREKGYAPFPQDAARAVEEIGTVPGQEANQILLRKLAENYWPASIPAAIGLARRGRQEGFDYLDGWIWHKWWDIAKQLADVPDPRSVKMLLRLLTKEKAGDQDSPSWRRQVAFDALVKIGGAETLPFLKQAMTEDDPSIRSSIVRAIGTYGRVEWRDILLSALRDEDYTVRAAAAGSLGKLKLKSAVPALQAAQDDAYWVVRLAVELALREIA